MNEAFLDPVKAKQAHYMRIIRGLESENAQLKTEIEYLKREILSPNQVPEKVRDWMRDYDLAIWEMFWCFEHKQWYIELDSLFPYHLEGSCCELCV